jgi:hypothetical protein
MFSLLIKETLYINEGELLPPSQIFSIINLKWYSEVSLLILLSESVNDTQLLIKLHSVSLLDHTVQIYSILGLGGKKNDTLVLKSFVSFYARFFGSRLRIVLWSNNVLATGLFAIGVDLPKSYMAKHAKSLLAMVVPVRTARLSILRASQFC